jgi:autotransporter-associated beta strand protein
MRKSIFLGLALTSAAVSSGVAQQQRVWSADPATPADFMVGANWNPPFDELGWLPTDIGVITNGGTAVFAGTSESVAALAQIWVGNLSGTSGNFSMTGGTLALTSDFNVGRQGATGTVIFSDTTGTTNVTTNSFRAGSMADTSTTAANASITISGANTFVTSASVAGAGLGSVASSGLRSTGTITVTDGATFTKNGTTAMIIGGDNNVASQNGGTGTLVVSNGGSVFTGGNLAVGRNATAEGTVLVNGGNITTATNLFIAGVNGASTGGHGTVTINSGTITTNDFSVREGTGTINLNGGTVKAKTISESTGSGNVNFNGSLIQVLADTADFFLGYEREDLNIQSGGLNLDTNSFSVSLTQGLIGTGAFDKQGFGTLIVNGESLYSGGTLVSGGSLIVSLGGTLGTGSIVVKNSASLDFDYGYTSGSALELQLGSLFTLDQNLIFSGLTIAGNNFAPGVYDYTTLKTAYPSIFADGGSGQITVAAIPEPSSVILALGGFAGLVFFRRRICTLS